jgi:tellurite resistance protein
MRDQYAERLRQDGQRARLHAIAVTLKPDPNEAENAFCLAAAVALADNRIADSESRLLDDLAGWLEFDADRVARLLGMLTADANEEKS